MGSRGGASFDAGVPCADKGRDERPWSPLASRIVRDWPVGVVESDLKLALAEGWRLGAVTLEYAPVGAGSYHWLVAAEEGQRWFVSVDQLDEKAWLGDTREATFRGLRTAMDVALALSTRAGLSFVVSPIPTHLGETVLHLTHNYAVGVFPYVGGTSGEFGEVISPAERAALVELLAALHRSTPAVSDASRCKLGLSRRAGLEAALSDLDQPWSGGAFGQRTRALLAEHADPLRHRLAELDELATRVAAANREPVITHGEPHPGNVIRTGTRHMLVDWDTVGLAVPERDLWMVLETDQEAAQYREATGRPVDDDALAFYRLRWSLDDISIYVEQFRSPHQDTEDSERGWLAFKHTIEAVAR